MGLRELVVRELKEHPGRPFIGAFMALMIIAAVLLAVGEASRGEEIEVPEGAVLLYRAKPEGFDYEGAAEFLAEAAYVYLVLGVVLELVREVYEARRRR